MNRGSVVARDGSKTVKRAKTALWYWLLSSVFVRQDDMKGYLQTVKVSGILVSTLRIIEPRNLAIVFGWLRCCLDPSVEICSYRRHLLIQLDSFLNWTGEDIFVDPENSPVNTWLDLFQLDDMDEGFDVTPLNSVFIIERYVGQIPVFSAKVGHLTSVRMLF
jgi:hypothetical protein